MGGLINFFLLKNKKIIKNNGLSYYIVTPNPYLRVQYGYFVKIMPDLKLLLFRF